MGFNGWFRVSFTRNICQLCIHLIILFEDPSELVMVTIGTYSGTVSRIRIRATTVTDFDRKEVIIPNKAFVTERLINWTLSDTVTRIIIH